MGTVLFVAHEVAMLVICVSGIYRSIHTGTTNGSP
jgi:hypothetical protein